MRRTGADERGVPMSRRALLRATTVAGAAGLAGCGGVTDRTYTASATSMDEAKLAELGVERTASRTITRSAERQVGPVEGSVTVESKLTTFSGGETTPPPSEAERWSESDAALSSWAGNVPVRGLPAASALEAADLVPESAPFDSVPAAAVTLLYPDTVEGAASPSDLVAVMPGDNVSWGDRESGGTVTLDEAAAVYDAEAFLPPGATLPEDGR